MRSGRRFQVGLTSLLIFTFLSSPLVNCTSGPNVAFAVSDETAGPEGGLTRTEGERSLGAF